MKRNIDNRSTLKQKINMSDIERDEMPDYFLESAKYFLYLKMMFI